MTRKKQKVEYEREIEQKRRKKNVMHEGKDTYMEKNQ